MSMQSTSSPATGLLVERKQYPRSSEPRTGVANVMLVWEPVESSGVDWRPDSCTVERVAFYRAKVPGGWLVAMKGSYQAHGMGLAFYPDPLNAWNDPHMAGPSACRESMS